MRIIILAIISIVSSNIIAQEILGIKSDTIEILSQPKTTRIDSLELNKTNSDKIITHTDKNENNNSENDTENKFNINWPQALVGSIPPIIIFLIGLIISILRNWKTNKILSGEWHSYHFSRSNYIPILKSSKWTVKQKIYRTKIEINISDQENQFPELDYLGRISSNENFLSIDAKGRSHSETFQATLLKPIPNNDTIMLGFNLGRDFNHELYTTPLIACRKKRTKKEAEIILKESYKWFDKECCIRLTKEPIKEVGTIKK